MPEVCERYSIEKDCQKNQTPERSLAHRTLHRNSDIHSEHAANYCLWKHCYSEESENFQNAV